MMNDMVKKVQSEVPWRSFDAAQLGAILLQPAKQCSRPSMLLQDTMGDSCTMTRPARRRIFAAALE